MEKDKLLNFVELYFNNSDEDIELKAKELEEAGIDAVHSEQKTLELIKQAKREVRIEKGKIFRDEFYKLLDKSKGNTLNIEKEMPELAIAFRKLEEAPDSDGILDDMVKMKLLEYMRKRQRGQ